MPASSRCTLIDTAWPGHCKRAPEALKAAILPHFHAIGLGTGATEPHACPAYAIFFIYSALLSSPSSPHGLPPEEALLPNVDVMRHMGIHRLARLHLGERLCRFLHVIDGARLKFGGFMNKAGSEDQQIHAIQRLLSAGLRLIESELYTQTYPSF